MPMLTSDNYTMWAIRAQAALDVHTVWEAVAPGDAAVNARKDKAARALLLGALPEDVLLQVATKLTAREVWDSLKVRFVGADRVCAARLATLRGEFDRLKMADGEALGVYAGRLAGMAARYASLGETLGDEALVKKLLDTVPDRLFPVVAGIEQFCDTATMAFDEALGRLRAFEERVQRREQDGGERGGEQLMLTMEQWRARERGRHGVRDDDGPAERGVGRRKRTAWALLQLRTEGALQARLHQAKEGGSSGGAGTAGARWRRPRRPCTPLSHGLGGDCWGRISHGSRRASAGLPHRGRVCLRELEHDRAQPGGLGRVCAS
ncbi:retrotransposon protein [Hordeum vulgare]|nr:retrotransposon protein [Hordeum vulgare]